MPRINQQLPSPATTDSPSDTPAVPHLPETGFLRQRKVLRLVPFSRSTLWRRVKQRTFPQPLKLSAGVTAWRAEDIRSWIADPTKPP